LGISAAEAALARLIATGMSVSRAAETLGISRNTARTQLKSIYAKTGQNTQARLVARILTGPALLTRRRES
jgi:DNA-binding CsgD family transcriptional regulator